MEAYREALYQDHVICARMAEQRQLSFGEVEYCSAIYLALKVSFLHGLTPDRFYQMKPKTQVVAHSKGYAAFRAWVHRRNATGQ